MANPAIIVDRETLVDAITHHLLEEDVVANDVSLFISMAEDRLMSEFTHETMETKVTGTLTSGVLVLPSDFVEMRSFSFDSASPRFPLAISDEVFERRTAGGATGVPLYTRRIGNELHFAPAPDANYAYTFYYYARFARLVNNADTNGLLTLRPSLYLSASMVEAYVFLDDPENEARWENVYQRAKRGAQSQDVRSKHRGLGSRMQRV